MTRKLLKDAGTHALLLILLLIAAVLAFYLLLPHSPIGTVEARPVNYLTSAGERAHEQVWAPITYNLAARLVFTHTPKLMCVINDSGRNGYLKVNAASLDVTTPTAHFLIENDEVWCADATEYGQGPLQVRSIDFVLWDQTLPYTNALTAGTQIEAYEFWAAGWW